MYVKLNSIKRPTDFSFFLDVAAIFHPNKNTSHQNLLHVILLRKKLEKLITKIAEFEKEINRLDLMEEHRMVNIKQNCKYSICFEFSLSVLGKRLDKILQIFWNL